MRIGGPPACLAPGHSASALAYFLDAKTTFRGSARRAAGSTSGQGRRARWWRRTPAAATSTCTTSPWRRARVRPPEHRSDRAAAVRVEERGGVRAQGPPVRAADRRRRRSRGARRPRPVHGARPPRRSRGVRPGAFPGRGVGVADADPARHRRRAPDRPCRQRAAEPRRDAAPHDPGPRRPVRRRPPRRGRAALPPLRPADPPPARSGLAQRILSAAFDDGRFLYVQTGYDEDGENRCTAPDGSPGAWLLNRTGPIAFR